MEYLLTTAVGQSLPHIVSRRAAASGVEPRIGSARGGGQPAHSPSPRPAVKAGSEQPLPVLAVCAPAIASGAIGCCRDCCEQPLPPRSQEGPGLKAFGGACGCVPSQLRPTRAPSRRRPRRPVCPASQVRSEPWPVLRNVASPARQGRLYSRQPASHRVVLRADAADVPPSPLPLPGRSRHACASSCRGRGGGAGWWRRRLRIQSWRD